MTRAERLLAGAIAGLVAIYAAGALVIWPSVFPDPAYGLLVHKSMSAGAPWNHVTEPTADDIARDVTYFYTVWSPGQWAVPSAVQALGLTLGQAIRIVNLGAALIGLAGWYLLFRALTFERRIALAACLIIAASRTFGFSFLAYVGSDQLAFAAFPYLAWALYVVRSRWPMALLAPAAVLAGFFLKNSMAIYMSAWTAAVLIAGNWSAPRRERPWTLAAAVALGLGGALWLLESLYLSRGWTPVTYQPSWSTNPAVYLLPPVMPLLAATGVDDVLSRLFANESLPMVDYKNSLLLLVPLFAAVAAWGVAECRHPSRRETRLIVAGFVAMVSVAFIGLLATGSGASLDLSRHYMIPGVLLLPLLGERIAAIRSRALMAMVLLALTVPATYGILSFAANWRRHYVNRMAHTAETGIAHLTLSPRVAGYLRTLDQRMPAPGSLVVVPIPVLALEFSQTRALATSATSDGMRQFADTAWNGRVANLVVIAEQAGQTPEEIRAWLATFKSYDPARWRRVSADGFSFFVPDGQPVDGRWLESQLPGTVADAW